MKEKKTITVALGDQKRALKDHKKDGWECVGFGFATEGPGFAELYLERSKGKDRKASANKDRG